MSARDPNSRDYDFKEIEVDPRFARCEYEMKLTFGSWIVFAALSIGLCYGLSRGGAEEMTYICGIPNWFFWGECVMVAVFFCIVCFICKFVYKDMDLSDTPSGADSSPSADTAGGRK